MLNNRGMTILLTTYYLEEAEELCDKIAIINHGKIIVDENKRDLLSRLDGKEITFYLDREIAAVPDNLAHLKATLVDPRTLKIAYTAKDTPVGSLIAAVQASGLGIADLTTDQSDLEDVFLQLTEQPSEWAGQDAEPNAPADGAPAEKNAAPAQEETSDAADSPKPAAQEAGTPPAAGTSPSAAAQAGTDTKEGA